MKETRRSIEIQATAPEVWQALTDFASYPKWMPLSPRITGRLMEGEYLEVSTPTTTVRLVLHKVEPERELSWSSAKSNSDSLAGVIDCKERFLIEPLSEDRTLFVRATVWSGLFAPLIVFFVRSKEANDKMSQALKRYVERPKDAEVVTEEDTTVWPPPPVRLL